MAILINFFDNVILQAISEEIVPKVSFFKDRYFPTGAGDIFKANEVLTEYRSGDRKLAAFVDQKAGDIPIGRRSYEVHSYKPAYIAPSRLLTLDELTKRGFGEALYPGMDEAQRAARLLADDMNDMENRIARREEWMAAETMIGNGCVMQEYIDGATKGDSLVVKFYDGTSDHTYTASKKWNENGGDFWGDVKAMCRMLSARGLPAKDLILGTDVADYILTDERTRQLLDKNSGIIVGEIRQQLTQYDGVVFMGTLNFGGFMLNVFSVDETYEDETGKSARYFPATAAMVTAPDCGHMVCVLHNSDSQEMGTCIGTFWNEDNKPVGGKKQRYRYDYNDKKGKAFEQYDGDSGDYEEKIDGNAKETIGKNLDFTVGGDVTFKVGASTVKVCQSGTIEITGTTVKITGATVNISGGSGDCKINGVSLVNHKHEHDGSAKAGPYTVSGNTGVPVK